MESTPSNPTPYESLMVVVNEMAGMIDKLGLTPEEQLFALKVNENLGPLIFEQWVMFSTQAKLRPVAMSAAAAMLLMNCHAMEKRAIQEFGANRPIEPRDFNAPRGG